MISVDEGTVWLHNKSAHYYIVVGHCVIEQGAIDAVLYRRVNEGNGAVWCRPFSEFTDGRFVRVKWNDEL